MGSRPHPLYSLDIASSDYHLFRSMAHGLAEQHFYSYEDAKTVKGTNIYESGVKVAYTKINLGIIYLIIA